MSSEITVALIGTGGALVGAVVGAAATIGATVWQQRRAAAADLRREAEERQEAARVAARLVQADIDVLRVRVRAARKKRRYWSPPFALPLAAWQEHREQLAAQLPDEVWTNVNNLFRTVTALEAQVASARVRSGRTRPPLGPMATRQVELALDRCGPAFDGLATYTKDTSAVLSDDDAAREVDDDSVVAPAPAPGAARSTSRVGEGAVLVPTLLPPEPQAVRALCDRWPVVAICLPDEPDFDTEQVFADVADLVDAGRVVRTYPAEAHLDLIHAFETYLRHLTPAELERRKRAHVAGDRVALYPERSMWRVVPGLAEQLGLCEWSLTPGVPVELEATTARELRAAIGLALCHPKSSFRRTAAKCSGLRTWKPVTTDPAAFAALYGGSPTDLPPVTNLRLRNAMTPATLAVRAVSDGVIWLDKVTAGGHGYRERLAGLVGPAPTTPDRGTGAPLAALVDAELALERGYELDEDDLADDPDEQAAETDPDHDPDAEDPDKMV